jgi:hypothetical protein
LPGAVVLSVPLTLGIVRAIRPLTDFPLEIFFVDALLCMTLVAASRLVLRLPPWSRPCAHPTAARPSSSAPAARGRALARELADDARRRASSGLSTTTRH